MKIDSICVFVLLFVLVPVAADDKPAFTYDKSKTETYFAEVYEVEKAGDSDAAKAVKQLLKEEVDEISSDNWGPFFYQSEPVGFNGRHLWLNWPDEMLMALSMTAPYLDEESYKNARKAADREFMKYPPFQVIAKEMDDGTFRGYFEPNEFYGKKVKAKKWVPRIQQFRNKFKTFYGIWAYAHYFDRWDYVKKAWEPMKKIKEDLVKEGGFEKVHWSRSVDKTGGPKVLTQEWKDNKYKRITALRYMTAGIHPFYHHGSPNLYEKHSLMSDDIPVRIMAALLGYGRIAKKMGEEEEYKWAMTEFDKQAEHLLQVAGAPNYWAVTSLTPEVARLLRDNAGDYLKELAQMPSVLVANMEIDSEQFKSEQPWVVVLETHQNHVSMLGVNGAVPPCSGMSNFLTQAWLFQRPAGELDRILDTPWCKADYWYAQKCAMVLNEMSKTAWKKQY